MKTLLLLRHGKSSWDDPDLADHDRPLAPRGTRAGTLMGRYLRRHGVRPDLVLCSTARRAAGTLDLVLEEIGRDVPVEHERGLYLCGPRILMARLRDVPAAVGCLLVVGHNPDLHELAMDLAGEGEPTALRALHDKFPTAACATFTLPVETWREVRSGAGRLTDYVQPKKLA